uniref:Flavonoid 3'-monooxygenase-like n=1 Tax=Nicotiana tabacum TaxID=4097 RepID=A0A1S4B3C3_TOBAC|nr:PREDICTED: flavonoid 3'-monooxygenase-like [Nicotiana tabacum]
MTWAPYGAFWRQARKIYLSKIFNRKRLESFKYIHVEETRILISCLHSLSGKPVFLKDHFPQFTLCTMSRMVMSVKYYNDESKSNTSIVSLEKLQWMLDESFLLNGVINLGDWVPLLSCFDSQGYVKRMKALGKSFVEFHNSVLEDHKAKAKEKSFQRTRCFHTCEVISQVRVRRCRHGIADVKVSGRQQCPKVSSFGRRCASLAVEAAPQKQDLLCRSGGLGSQLTSQMRWDDLGVGGNGS